MATFYLDYEGGNDSNDGTTFANRWKTLTNGATAARIAPGDIIRIMASPDPTSLGQTGTWTQGPNFATINISSSTNASPIQVTTAAPNTDQSEVQTGDYVVITGHTTNTSANGLWECTRVSATQFTLNGSTGNGVGGATGTRRTVNPVILKLTTAVTANIACIGNRNQLTNWTQSTNVTCTINTTDYKQGGECQQIAIAAGFTTGKAAYFPTGTLDLSGYQQVSFWIKQTAGTVATAGQITLRLCTDTLGDTTAHTISVPALGLLNQWTPVTVNLGTNLNSAIQSIALYVATDSGAQTFLLDNIIACKAASSADSLSLRSLVGKNSAGEVWYPIQSINGVVVVLDGPVNTINTNSILRGYAGTSGSATVWKRESIETTVAASLTANVDVFNDSGTAGSPITYSGGWNRTDMSTQTGETFLDGKNGAGYGWAYPNIRNWLSVSNITFVRYNTGLFIANGANNLVLDNCNAIANTSNGFFSNSAQNIVINHSNSYISSCGLGYNIATAFSTFSNIIIVSCGGNAINLSGNDMIFNNIDLINNAGSALAPASSDSAFNLVFNDVLFSRNATSGINVGRFKDVKIVNSTFDNNSVRAGVTIGITFAYAGSVILKNTTFTNTTTKVSTAFNTNAKSYLYSMQEDGNSNNNIIYFNGGTISTDTTTTQSGSGFSWRFNPTSTTLVYDAIPLKLSIAKIACRANKLVTVRGYVRRDNTELTIRMRVPAYQLAGVSETTAIITASANTWEQITLTFTPTEQGVIEVFAEAWGGTTRSGWIDTLEITQAP